MNKFSAIIVCKILSRFFFTFADFLSMEEIFLLQFHRATRSKWNTDGKSRILPWRVFIVEEVESRLIESTEVNSSLSPRRGDRFPALISLRAASSFKHLFYFSHYIRLPHLWRGGGGGGGRGKSRGIQEIH